MTGTRICGRVVQERTGHPMPAHRVEVWTHELALGGMLGTSETVADGAFAVEIPNLVTAALLRILGAKAFFKVFKGSVQVATTGFLWRARRPDEDVLIELGAPAPPPVPFAVRGRVRETDGTAPATTTVRAFDKDLRSEEILGEARTDEDGDYVITYGPERFRRAEKLRADLVVRAYDPGGRVTAESGVVFNAPENAAVHLVLGVGSIAGPSEYEQLVAGLEPALDGVALQDLTEDDIAFLAGEAGADPERIRALRAAHRSRIESEVAAAVFYGFEREGVGADLSIALGAPEAAWRTALEKALDDNVIPAGLRPQLEIIIGRLRALRASDHGVDVRQLAEAASLTIDELGKQRAPLLEQLRRLWVERARRALEALSPPEEVRDALRRLNLGAAFGAFADLGAAIRSIAQGAQLSDRARAAVIAWIDRTGTRLPQMPRPDAPVGGALPELGEQISRGQLLLVLEAAGLDLKTSTALATEIATLPALHDDALTRLRARGAMDEATAQRTGMLATMTHLLGSVSDARRIVAVLADQGRTTLQALAGIGPERWREACAKAGIAESGAGASASEAIQQVAAAFPRTALSAAIKRRAPTVDADAVGQIQALQVRFPNVLSSVADLSALTSDERATADAWRRLLRMHPGLGLESMLHGDAKQAASRLEERLSNLAAVEVGLGEHASEDLSDASLAQRFPQLPESERQAVGATLRARTRVLAVTGHSEGAAELMARGYDSATSIALTNPHVLSSELGLKAEIADPFHENAVRASQAALRPLWFALDARTEDAWTSRIAGDRRDFLRELPGADRLFGGAVGCDCEHCRSVLSPAAYFVDLMTLVEDRILARTPRFATITPLHPLHLRARRPDLWTLPLTCQNTNDDVLYLDVVRPVLARYIVSGGQPQRASGSDESVLAGAFTELAGSVSSFTLPFSHAHHAAEIALATRGSSLAALAESLGGPDRLALSMSAAQERAIGDAFDAAHAVADARALSDVYDMRTKDDARIAIPATGSLGDVDIVELIKASGLSRDDVAAVLATRFVSDTGRASIVPGRHPGSLQTDWEAVRGLHATNLDRFHRFVRLLRHTPWSVRELDLLIEHSGAADLGDALPLLTRARRVQQRLGLDVETLAAVLGPLPTRSLHDDTHPLGQRLFGSKVVGGEPAPALPGAEVEYPPRGSTAPTPGPQPDLTARLLTGLGIDDDAFRALIEALTPVLGVARDGRAEQVLLLDARGLGALLRHARVARSLELSIPDLFRVLSLFGRATTLLGVDDVLALIEDVSWLRSSAYSLDDLAALTSSAGEPVDQDRAERALALAGEEGRLSFTDTIFTFVPQIDAARSRRIILENAARFVRIGDAGPVPTEDAGLLRLADGFDPRAPLAGLADLGVVEPLLRERLLSHSPKAVFAAAAAEVLQSSSEHVRAWLDSSHIDVRADTITRPLPGEGDDDAADPRVIAFGALRRAQLATQRLTAAEARLIADHPAAFGSTPSTGIAIETLRAIETYRRLRSPRVSTEAWNHLLGSYAGGRFTTDPLGLVLQLEPRAAAALQDAFSPPVPPATALAALSRLAEAAGFVRALGISAGALGALLGANEAALERAANELWATIPEAKREDSLKRLRNLERDALVEYLLRAFRLRPTELSPFRTADDLYGYFLLDVQMDGCAHTTKVAAAISSAQLYVQRVRLGLEQSRRSGPDHLRVTTDIDDSEWEWRRSYRLWEANRKIFLHPECYLESYTRDDRTPLFRTLEDELLQAKNLDEQAVLDAYANYLKGFEEIATLGLAGAFHDRQNDVVHLFGATPSEPPTYYYRTVKGLGLSRGDASSGVSWGIWQKADMRIPIRRVSPTMALGRLVVFWLTTTTRPITIFEQGTSKFDKYEHRLSVQYVWQQSNGLWTSPQKLSLQDLQDPAEFPDGDGILFEKADEGTEPVEGHRPPNPLLESVYTQSHYKAINLTVPSRAYRFVGADRVFHRSVDLLRQEWRDPERTRPSHQILVEWTTGVPSGISRAPFDFLGFIPPITNSGLTMTMWQRALWLTDFVQDGFEWHFSATASIRDRDIIKALSPEVGERIFHAALMQLPEQARVEPAEGFTYLIEIPTASLLLVKKLGGTRFALTRVGSALGHKLRQRLFAGGIDELLALGTQQLEEPTTEITLSELVEDQTASRLPDRTDWTGSMAVYWRELFLHIPLLLAAHCTSQSRFEAAKRWLGYVFDPTAGDGPEVWGYSAFRGLTPETLEARLRDPEALTAYHDDPFNPHAIARLRPIAYAKAAFLQYVENLVDWGDSLFARFTRESTNEATQLYLFAQGLLGQRPLSTPRCDDDAADKAPTYERLAKLAGGSSEVLITAEDISVDRSHRKRATGPIYVLAPVEVSAGVGAERLAPELLGPSWKLPRVNGKELGSIGAQPRGSAYFSDTPELSFVRQLNMVFCVPGCGKIEQLRRLVEDRLFKIRHCQNIDGEHADVLPFEPPIDPDLLAAARAAGLSLDDIVNAGAGRVPPYRFAFIVERAKGQASALASIGSALLAAIEKKEGEELARLRLVHQKNLSRLSQQVREDEVRIAQEGIAVLERRKDAAEYRRDFHQQLMTEAISPGEAVQQALQHEALHFRVDSAGLNLASAIAHLVPQIGAPTAMKYGGAEIGTSLGHFSSAVGQAGGIIEALASFAGVTAGYARRSQGWEHARTLAEHEIRQINQDLAAARLRLSIAERSVKLQEESDRQLDEILERYDGKLAGLGLYMFYATQLTRLYRNAFDGALSLARLAERALRYERGDDAPALRGDYWDATHAGLLAGERLLYDLVRLEQWFLETHERKLEIDQTFPLSQIDPLALWKLKDTGDCRFTLPELFFDLAYPGHYRRRIRAVRLTIPAIAGPYVNVSATLELESGYMRHDPDATLEEVPLQRTSRIATSSAQNDAGMFELSFGDARYLPFEGEPAVSRWRLRLPAALRSFDYESIDDVLVHVAYTAEYDETLRADVESRLAALQTALATLPEGGFSRAISFRREFGGVLSRLQRSPAGTAIPFELKREHWPFFLRGFELSVESAAIVVRPAPGASLAGLVVELDGTPISDFAIDPETGIARSSVTLAGELIGEHRISIGLRGAAIEARLADLQLEIVVTP
jgi:Tc toxin complex TcA C-terminal TcB-binding domain/Neuraminidase-like domain